MDGMKMSFELTRTKEALSIPFALQKERGSPKALRKRTRADGKPLFLSCARWTVLLSIGWFLWTRLIGNGERLWLRESKGNERRILATAANRLVIQIMTHKRPEQLRETVSKLSVLGVASSIIVIWNDVETLPESFGITEFFAELDTHVKIVRRRSNHVTNRWIYHGEEDAMVLNLDDDVYIDESSLRLGFEVSRLYPSAVVGFARRTLFWDEDIGAWQYDRGGGYPRPEHIEHFNIFIGKAWIASSRLLCKEDDEDPMFRKLKAFLHNTTKERKGCDDMAFNMYLFMKYRMPLVFFSGLKLHSAHVFSGKGTSYSTSSDVSRAEWRFYRDACIVDLLELLNLEKPPLPIGQIIQVSMGNILEILDSDASFLGDVDGLNPFHAMVNSKIQPSMGTGAARRADAKVHGVGTRKTL